MQMFNLMLVREQKAPCAKKYSAPVSTGLLPTQRRSNEMFPLLILQLMAFPDKEHIPWDGIFGAGSDDGSLIRHYRT